MFRIVRYGYSTQIQPDQIVRMGESRKTIQKRDAKPKQKMYDIWAGCNRLNAPVFFPALIMAYTAYGC
jgi:hypothetical protein